MHRVEIGQSNADVGDSCGAIDELNCTFVSHHQGHDHIVLTFGRLDWTSADKHALLWARRVRGSRLPSRPRLGGASGAASTAIVAMRLRQPSTPTLASAAGMALVMTFGLDFCRQARIAVGETRALGPAPTPTKIGGASGGASIAIVAVMNLETRHEVPHFENPPEQPCGCQDGEVATTCREAEG